MSLSTDIVDKIGELRCGNRDFRTNAFFSTKQLISLIESSFVVINTSNQNCVVLLSEEEHLTRLYFYVKNTKSLKHLDSMLHDYKKKPIIADIIGKEVSIEELSIELERSGFYRHNKLMRMSRKPQEFFGHPELNVIFAEKENAGEIIDFLYSQFDIFTSQLPSIEKVLEAIDKREITVVKQNNIVVGLAYFEPIGERMKYLYQIAVKENFRGKGIADNLLRYHFKHFAKDMSFQLWVETKNVPATKLYQKYGFIADGLMDNIMVYKRNS